MRFMNWLIIIGILLGGVAFGLFYFAFTMFKTWKTIKDLPTGPISQVYNQLAEVKGRTIQGDQPLISPASQQPCVFYEIKIEEYRRSHSSRGSSTGTWHTIHRTKSKEPIYIEDGTGQACILLQGASTLFTEDSVDRAGGFWEGDFPPHILKYLTSVGIDTKSFFGLASRRLRCSETFVAVGEELYVLGFGTQSGDLVQFQKKKGIPHIISDYPESKVTQHYLLYWIAAGLGGVALLVGAFYLASTVN